MKKIWFKRKLYGFGWTFGTWESVVVTLVYVVALVWIFRKIDLNSHSGSDTLIGFAMPVLVLSAVFVVIAWLTGERPRWQWGKRIEDTEDVLLRGGVVVMPTDTTYGIVGSALSERTVNEIYRLRKRDLGKPFIILVAGRNDLKKFGVKPTEAQEKILRKVWPVCVRTCLRVYSRRQARAGRPGPTSVILPCPHDKFAYLHRGKKTLGFRVPAKPEISRLLRQVGPLVAPSANPQGLPVAKTISEARAYFGHHVDFYQDGGTISAPPSKLIDITDGTEKILRP